MLLPRAWGAGVLSAKGTSHTLTIRWLSSDDLRFTRSESQVRPCPHPAPDPHHPSPLPPQPQPRRLRWSHPSPSVLATRLPQGLCTPCSPRLACSSPGGSFPVSSSRSRLAVACGRFSLQLPHALTMPPTLFSCSRPRLPGCQVTRRPSLPAPWWDRSASEPGAFRGARSWSCSGHLEQGLARGDKRHKPSRDVPPVSERAPRTRPAFPTDGRTGRRSYWILATALREGSVVTPDSPATQHCGLCSRRVGVPSPAAWAPPPEAAKGNTVDSPFRPLKGPRVRPGGPRSDK